MSRVSIPEGDPVVENMSELSLTVNFQSIQPDLSLA